GCRPGSPWRGTDRPAPQNANIADPRRSPPASLPTEVEDRATLCLVPEFSAARCPLRAIRREFSCDATPRLLPHSLTRFMRWLLHSLTHVLGDRRHRAIDFRHGVVHVRRDHGCP